MSEIVQEFERQLERWRTQYAGRPEQELVRLYLLALEREENVTVAYDQRILGPRLAKMNISLELHDVVKPALVRIWAEEEQHTRYVQDMLRAVGRPSVRARMIVQQLAGLLGGWSVAVRQHRGWSDAPVSRAAATLLVWAGEISGRVPQAVRRHLGLCSFRDFCRYNFQTEGTARLCWERLAALAADLPEITETRVQEFRRIAHEEECHRQVFGILANALTDDDELQVESSAEEIAAQIQSVNASGAWTDPTVTLPHNIARSCAA